MDSMDNKVFLFNESSQITFLLQLFYRGKEGRTFVCLDAKIELGSNVITLSVDIPDDSKTKDFSSILTKTYKKKDYKICKASIDGKDITLKTDEEIRFTHFRSGKGQQTCSMTLKKFYYTYKGTEPLKLYRLFTTASTLLSPYLTDLSVSGGKMVGTVDISYEGSCCGVSFCLFKDEHHVYVQTEGDIVVLLRALSFFFCNSIEYDMVYSYDKENNSHIEVIAPHYSILAAKRNNMLGYLFSGDVCLGHLCDFLDIIKDSNVNTITGKMIEVYINNFVRAEYLDNISKLLLYSSILEKMAKVKNGDDTYNVIKEYLRKNHIKIEKINDNVTKKKLLDAEEIVISNYIQLRNFFVHHLGTKEAERFLDESDVLFYLKLTISILILKSIGVSEINFDKFYHDISVFDESVADVNYISNMLIADGS